MSARKSGRSRVPNKKYFSDTFTDLTSLDILSSSEEEIAPVEQAEEGQIAEVLEAGQVEDSGEDEEFAFESDALSENDDIDEQSSSADQASDGSGIATPLEDFEDAASYASADSTRARKDGDTSTSQRVSNSQRRKSVITESRIRGIPDPARDTGKGSKAEYYYSLFGQGAEDLEHMKRSRDQWFADVTLPSRPNGSSTKGIHHYFSHTDEKRRMETTVGWDWYRVYGGREKFSEYQKTRFVNFEEGSNFIPQNIGRTQTVFMGPYSKQRRFDIDHLNTLALNEAWRGSSTVDERQEIGSALPKRKKRRDGWMFNVGAGVRCQEWAPNHHGDTQYLAVSTIKPKAKQTEYLKYSPAFTAQSFPSSIQIWALSSTAAPDRKSLLNPDQPPLLQLVLCFDWGDAKHLRWCPMPRDFRDESEHGMISIGLLAGVWSDGHVRVIDVQLDKAKIKTTCYGTSSYTQHHHLQPI